MLHAIRSAGARLFSFSTMLAALLVTFVFFLCVGLHLFSDPDIWWHLRDAESLLQSHRFIYADSYSFTVLGKPWIDSEWLSELAFYAAWKSFGPGGLFVLTISLLEAVVLGVCWLGWQRTRNIKSALLACLPFVLMLSVSMGPRTVLVGWLCLIAEIFLLREFRAGRDRLWLLPLLFAFWINAHGTWPIGFIYLSLFVICGLFQASWGSVVSERLSHAQRKRLILVSGVSALALFLNPYGLHLILFPIHMLFGHKLMIESVQEWQSLDFHSVRGKSTYIIIAGLIVSNGVRKRTWQLNELLFALTAILAAFTYTRLLVLAGIVLCPALAIEFDFFSPYAKEHDKPAMNFAIVAILVTILMSQIPSRASLSQQITKSCPEKALAYMEAAHLDGRVLNDLSWGGYLEANSPNTLVFIDSRSELFDQWGVLRDYLDATHIKSPLQIISQYQIRYALFPTDSPIVYLLTHTPSWKVRYQDETAILMEHDQPF